MYFFCSSFLKIGIPSLTRSPGCYDGRDDCSVLFVHILFSSLFFRESSALFFWMARCSYCLSCVALVFFFFFFASSANSWTTGTPGATRLHRWEQCSTRKSVQRGSRLSTAPSSPWLLREESITFCGLSPSWVSSIWVIFFFLFFFPFPLLFATGPQVIQRRGAKDATVYGVAACLCTRRRPCAFPCTDVTWPRSFF